MAVDSSAYFGGKMGVGWVKGLSFLCKDFSSQLNYSICKRKKKRIGNIDAVFEFRSPMGINDILPQAHCRIISLFPEEKRFPRSCFYLCDIKLSFDNETYCDKIDQFVKFYQELTTKCKQLDSWSPIVKRALADKNTILVFLFNGHDLQAVTKHLSQQTPGGAINGYRVVCVWCPYDALICWELDHKLVIYERTLADEDRILADQ